MIHFKTLALCACAAVMTLTACAQKKAAKPAAAKKSNATLVVYFSATGTTRAVATRIAKISGADLFEIVPAKAYTAADLDWRDKQSRSTLEMRNPKSRPAVKSKVKNMAQYSTIYVGFPVWWGTAPTIVRTFLESYDLSGKTIIPFATSGGSGIDNVHKELSTSAPKAKWRQGRLLNSASDKELKTWLGK